MVTICNQQKVSVLRLIIKALQCFTECYECFAECYAYNFCGCEINFTTIAKTLHFGILCKNNFIKIAKTSKT